MPVLARLPHLLPLITKFSCDNIALSRIVADCASSAQQHEPNQLCNSNSRVAANCSPEKFGNRWQSMRCIFAHDHSAIRPGSKSSTRRISAAMSSGARRQAGVASEEDTPSQGSTRRFFSILLSVIVVVVNQTCASPLHFFYLRV
jgi:hypothetical protein